MYASLFSLSVLLGNLGIASSKDTSLNALARKAGLKYFGSATDNPEFADEPYTEIMFSDMFGQTTPGNSMKWGPTEPSRGVYNYGDAEEVISRAQAANQIVRGHTLMWHSQMPNWVSNYAGNKSELRIIMKEHIAKEVAHFAGQLYAWDVVNEPFDDSGVMRSWIYYDAFGVDYIAQALQITHSIDEHAKLYINDYNLEYGGSKFDIALSTVSSLIRQGVPIDGVGFQGHLLVGSTPGLDTLIRVLTAFTDLGLEVAFTELDIRMTLPVTPEKLSQQATDYQTVVTACLSVSGCVGITIWDYTDRYS